MIRLVVGLALLPTAALTLLAAVQTIASLALGVKSAWPLTAGALAGLALWLAGLAEPRRPRWAAALPRAGRFLYVLGHELTHALAAWALGGTVLGLKVGADGGHADLSKGGTFVSLAPYCLPLYTVLAIAGYRLLLYVRPGLGLAPLLALVGLTLAGHWLMTGQCLWARRQPDLRAAGGLVFSLAVIGLANGLVLLILAKTFFPRAVGLDDSLRQVAALSSGFWAWNYGWLKALLGPIRRGYPV